MTRPLRPLLLAVMVVASVGFGLASGTVAAQDQGPSVDFSGCTEVTVTGEEYRITLYYEGGDIEDDNGPYNGTNTFSARDGKTIRKVSVSGNSGMKTAENPNFESCVGTTTETTTSAPTTTTETTETTTTESTTATTTTDGGSESTTTMTTTESQFDPDVEFVDCQTVTVTAAEYDGVTLYFGEGDIADYVGPFTGENSFSAQSGDQDQPLRKVSISSGSGMTSVENPNYESCLEEMGTTETESSTESSEESTTTDEPGARTDDGTDAETDGGVDSSLSSDGGDDATDPQTETVESTSTTDGETTAESTTDATTAETSDESSTEQAVSDDGRSTASEGDDGQETQNSWFADLLRLKFDSGQFAFTLMGTASLVAAGVLAVR